MFPSPFLSRLSLGSMRIEYPELCTCLHHKPTSWFNTCNPHGRPRGGVVVYACAMCLRYVPALYACSICLLYVPALCACSICLLYMPALHACSMCLLYMPALYACSMCPFFQWVDNATAGQQATSEEDPGEFYCCICSQTKSNTIPHHNGACDSNIGEMER